MSASRLASLSSATGGVSRTTQSYRSAASRSELPHHVGDEHAHRITASERPRSAQTTSATRATARGTRSDHLQGVGEAFAIGELKQADERRPPEIGVNQQHTPAMGVTERQVRCSRLLSSFPRIRQRSRSSRCAHRFAAARDEERPRGDGTVRRACGSARRRRLTAPPAFALRQTDIGNPPV